MSVSRQVYHEAVLKPFSESVFHHASQHGRKNCLLRYSINALAPAQVIAMAHLRIVIDCMYYSDRRRDDEYLQLAPVSGRVAMDRLKGLRDLEIVISPYFWREEKVSRFLGDLCTQLIYEDGMQELVKPPIRPLRLTMEPEYRDQDAEDEEIENTYLTFSGRNETEKIEKWLQKAEIELQFGHDVSSGVRPLPIDDRIIQSDNTRGVPSEGERKELYKRGEEEYERLLAKSRGRTALQRANEPPLVTVTPGVQVQKNRTGGVIVFIGENWT